MRLDNLSLKTKEDIKAPEVLLGVIKEDLKETINDLIWNPKERVEELRGRARVLQTIVQLLEK
jgi:hypothetical protein